MTEEELVLLDEFAGKALTGYVSGGLSVLNRKDECKEVATACYDLAIYMLKIRRVNLRKFADLDKTAK